jgi:hypothetical protein
VHVIRERDPTCEIVGGGADGVQHDTEVVVSGQLPYGLYERPCRELPEWHVHHVHEITEQVTGGISPVWQRSPIVLVYRFVLLNS